MCCMWFFFLNLWINFICLTAAFKKITKRKVVKFAFSSVFCRYFDGNLEKLFAECHVINPSKKSRTRQMNTRSSAQDMPCQICYLNYPNSVSVSGWLVTLLTLLSEVSHFGSSVRTHPTAFEKKKAFKKTSKKQGFVFWLILLISS